VQRLRIPQPVPPPTTRCATRSRRSGACRVAAARTARRRCVAAPGRIPTSPLPG